MRDNLTLWITLAGVGQLCVLAASALVPLQLDWRGALAVLPRLHRQLNWVYGGYTAMAIVAFGLISLFNASELAAGGGLARALCLYIAIFWGIRLALQAILDAGPHLTAWWLRAGYHSLTLVFLFFVCVYGYAACL